MDKKIAVSIAPSQRDLAEWVEQAVEEFDRNDLVSVPNEWLNLYRELPKYLHKLQFPDQSFYWMIEGTGEDLPDLIDRIKRMKNLLLQRYVASKNDVGPLVTWFDRVEMALIEKVSGQMSLSHALSEPYEAVFWNARDGMYMSTLEGRFLHCNDALLNMLKFEDPEDVLNMDIQKELYVDSQDRDKLVEHLKKDGHYDRHEFRYRCATGEIRTALESCYLVQNKKGLQYVVGLLVDITDEKASELKTQAYVESLEAKALQAGATAHREKRRKRSMVDVSDHANILVDHHSLSLVHVNSAFCKQFGYGKRDSTSLTLKDLISGEHWLDVFPEIMELENRIHFHLRDVACVTAQGQAFTAHLAFFVHQDDAGTFLCVEFSDQTQIQDLQQQLDRVNLNLHRVIEQASHAIIGFDRDGQVKLINRRLKSLLGYPKEKMRDFEFINDLFAIEEQRIKFTRFVHQILEGHHLDNLPVALKTRGGDILNIHLKTIPMDFRDGTPGFLAFLSDITGETELARLKTEQRQPSKRDKLGFKRQVEELSEQCRLLTHQKGEIDALLESLEGGLRDPLEVSAGFSRLYIKDHPNEEIAVIDTNIRKMYQILDYASEYRSLLSQNYQPNFTEVPLLDWLRELFEGIRDRKGGHWKLELEIQPSLTVVTDRLAVESILAKISDNAAQYGAGHYGLRCRVAKRKVWLEVTNNGPAIPPQELDRLFEPFYQLPEGKAQAGLGIGLSIVALYIKAMKSEVKVKSNSSKGTSFRFSIGQR